MGNSVGVCVGVLVGMGENVGIGVDVSVGEVAAVVVEFGFIQPCVHVDILE